ncbi:MAG: adenylyltransferase/cytidyltransferase family protein [Nitrososphaerota archaeon]|jgi:cytidyltransferase-like protein|nr:adenylyltransferase/cytidyltransferase family protein [Nitrososphaerota archaeon]MDG6952716.1 adenylyltransferase/cytidyltransferase family protein [Nitrososphaerota archaeon]MDG6955779.1 adenylyltransferase/cytidyltransferase family protein [Nitrososphaerota archaeon]MDG6957897.1 adenylyltransferase/cytidyltransferase family protein [Nitrososphaerota archaeon]MDG6959149.1 adenylyltransferase/cytidyltransferase family protein [Nitrososphaerota archaeon]
MNNKRVLAAVYSLGLSGRKVGARELAERLGLTPEEAGEELERLSARGLVKAGPRGTELTPRGRRSIRVVFIGGGFEVIHYGHLYTIEKARRLGDALVASVARDSTIRKRKSREPLIGERDRAKLLSALRQVDAAILGVEGDIYVTLERAGPDVVALGYDQYHMEDEIKAEAARRGMKLRVVRLDSPYPGIKTSRLLNEF